MTETLSSESVHEMTLKDAEYQAMSDVFEPPPSSWRSKYSDAIEIPPHLEELEPLESRTVLEIGCGDGRFTLLMAQRGAEVLAVDFSIEALRKLAARLPSGVAPTSYQLAPHASARTAAERIGLVQANASEFHCAPRVFDRALSATPLDSRDERMKMYCAVAESLADNGRYVAGVEHDDLLRRVMGMPVARRYTPGGCSLSTFADNKCAMNAPHTSRDYTCE